MQRGGIRAGLGPALAVILLLAGCSSSPPSPPSPPVVTSPVPSVSGPSSPSPSVTPNGKGVGFAVIGDFGAASPGEQQVSDAIRRWSRTNPLAAVVTVGDNVYETGQPSEFDGAWNHPYGWVDQRALPVVAALGNHDEDAEGNTHELPLFDLPGRWYARTIGPVRFVVLDANDPTNPDQMRFLEAELAKHTGAPWTVAVFHQPAYSCSFHASTPEVDRAWVPLFGPGGVDLVLNGHDHAYERFAPIDGVTYVVAGSGGADLYPASTLLCPDGTPDYEVADAHEHSFVYLRATRDSLTGRAVAADGAVIDTFDVPGR